MGYFDCFRSAVASRLEGLFRYHHRGQDIAEHASTSLELSPQQSRHFRRTARSGVRFFEKRSLSYAMIALSSSLGTLTGGRFLLDMVFFSKIHVKVNMFPVGKRKPDQRVMRSKVGFKIGRGCKG